MRESIRKRYRDSWSIILDIGHQIVPNTGKMKRVQEWFAVQGTKRHAERKPTEILHHLHRGEHATPSVVRAAHPPREGSRGRDTPLALRLPGRLKRPQGVRGVCG
jgi:hypothetical protein